MMEPLNTLTPGQTARLQKTIEALLLLHQAGALGGEAMPEDANPRLPKASEANSLYFTLPMALNYQRNSYKLWEAAAATYGDAETADVFRPGAVARMHPDMLRQKLCRHKLALQPNRHPLIWLRLCQTFAESYGGSVRSFFAAHTYSVAEIKAHMIANKKRFPYLSGEKIMNYWLYVMGQYTDAVFTDTENITVAPDTHVLQASVKLGLIQPEDTARAGVRETVSGLWRQALAGTGRRPIDIHTALWLWSRGGFAVDPNQAYVTTK